MSRAMQLAAACAIALAQVAAAGPACSAPSGEFVPRLRQEQQFQEMFDEDAYFGYATAIEGDILVIGAPLAREPGADWSGMVMIYRYDDEASEWVLEDTLYDDRLGDARFGAAVDVDTGGEYPRIIVGAPEYDDYDDHEVGAAEIWYYTGNSAEPWDIEGELSDPEGDAFDHFGHSVAIDGGYAVVGNPYSDTYGTVSGAAVLFEYREDLGYWTFPDEYRFNGEDDSWEEFGTSVDIKGEMIVVGAPENTSHWGMGESGVAYAFEIGNLSEPKLVKPDYEVGPDRFGYDVAIGDSIILVGSPGDSVDGHDNIGSAFIFEEIDSAWTVVERLVADDPDSAVWYGASVAAGEEFLVVGAPKWDGTMAHLTFTDAGKIYVYGASSYNLVQGITESWMWWGNEFGHDVATYECRVAAGAPYAWHFNANDLGKAHLYKCTDIDARWNELPIEPPYNSGSVADFRANMACGAVTDESFEIPIFWLRDDEAWVGTILPHLGSGGEATAICDYMFTEIVWLGGTVEEEKGTQRAAIWDDAGGIWHLNLLPMPPGASSSSVTSLCSDIQAIYAAGQASVDGVTLPLNWDFWDDQWQYHVLPNLQDGSMGKVNSLIVEDPEGQNIILVGQCRNANGTMRPVRWIKVGEEYQILPMPKLPDGGPSGIATSIECHADGNMTIIGRAAAAGGVQVPVQWRLMDGTWEPVPMSTDLDPPLEALTPLAMADEPWPGPIVGVGLNDQNRPEGVMWAPEYAGGALGFLGTSPGNQAVREAVAMSADWSIAVNLVSIDDPDGPTFPAILELLGEGEPDPCPADLDGDGFVGAGDLLLLLAAWGTPDGDVDGDGLTDVRDLLLLLAAWGECP